MYINYGTCLDLQGKTTDGIDVYNDGIRHFPKTGLFYFNKAITLANGGKLNEAMEAVKLSITYNPYHASSHHVLSLGVSRKNKIFGLLSSLVFLAIEPEGTRATAHPANVKTILGGNAKKTGEKDVTVNLETASLDVKKTSDDNFGSIEMLISLGAGLDFDDNTRTKPRWKEQSESWNRLLPCWTKQPAAKKALGGRTTLRFL